MRFGDTVEMHVSVHVAVLGVLSPAAAGVVGASPEHVCQLSHMCSLSVRMHGGGIACTYCKVAVGGTGAVQARQV